MLSALVRAVHSVEIIAPLADAAERRLRGLGYANVAVHRGDGYYGIPRAAPFDGIMVTAGAGGGIPPPLLDQLRLGGRMVIPVGGAFALQRPARARRWRQRRRVRPELFGTGKTWLSCALGHRACRDNRSVLYQRVPRLLEALGLARGDGRYARMLKNLARVQLLILDDWAVTPLTAEGRRDLMEIIDDQHDRVSTVVSQPSAGGALARAHAVLDRLVHGAHRIELK